MNYSINPYLHTGTVVSDLASSEMRLPKSGTFSKDETDGRSKLNSLIPDLGL